MMLGGGKNMTKSRIIAAVALVGAAVLTTGAVVFQPPDASRQSTSFERGPASTWGEVFARPGPIHVETLDTGIVHFPKELLLNGDHPAMDGFEDDGSALRVFAHLVRHQQRGDVLIDTGLDDVYATEPLGHMRGVGRLVMGWLGLSFSQKPGQDVHAQLRNANAAVGAVAAARASLAGRGPTKGDIDAAIVILGYDTESDFGAVRSAAIGGSAHHPDRIRRLVAGIPADVYDATSGELRERAASGESLIEI